MNFQELMQKMVELDQPVKEEKQADKDYDGDGEVESEKDEVWGSRMKAAEKSKEEKVDEEIVDECGDMMSSSMPPPMDAPKQADSVTMNVSMNGSGAGGIRDLLNVLKDIQDGPEDGGDDMPPADDMDMGPDSDHDVLLKKNIDSMADMIDDDFGNSMAGDDGPEMGTMAMVDPKDDGDGIHSSAGKVAHTEHPAMVASMKPGEKRTFDDNKIKITLENLYHEIKNR